MREMIRLLFNKRFRKTFFMFVGFFMQFWWLGKTKKFYHKEKANQKYKEVYRSQAKKFVGAAVEMGGLIIKLGQFVSSRVDILPKEYTDTLSELQDSVAPVDSAVAISRIETELGGRLSDHFTTFVPSPVAAASLGQVHKAVMKSGEEVAIKVMRPGIEATVSLDLATLKVLIAFARRTKMGKFVDLKNVYQEFEEVITEELDYLKEAKNLESFQESFRDFPGVTTPRVYGELTTSKVLVMEFIEGVKINELEKLEGASINKKKLASILYLSYLKQLMEDGFFHADPHPGNLLVKQDGTIAYIDFGMVGTISNVMKENIVKLAMSIYLKDGSGIVEAFDELGFLRKHADKTVLVKNVKIILSSFSEGSFSIEKMNNEGFLEELREFLYEQPFQIPSRTTFLGKAIMTVFSICNGLDKNFDVVANTKPYVEDLMSGNTANASTAKENVLDQVKNTLLQVIPTSRKLFHFVDQLESGELRIQPSKTFEKNILNNQALQTRKIVLAVFGTGLLISGSQMFADNQLAGILLMVSGGLLTIFQAGTRTSVRRRRRTHPRPPFMKAKE
ncbi:AarF/ABC1/UbiB kinase family protein [Neobacillus sp. MM2021_6]|uniref:ABC1 kinase family protein n=1 Tax=Bacillaceae TaxID=186817 RepID=UPI0014086C48|nr:MULTISPECIES: AarF/UbiB family protein [Bacillaceae]MBO0962198.1 AarF/ABC1/UbiB kinase family protein [Neobacillus sp. MM2021_6]NHC19022.1 AarF/ABC1/UbiB kinase family protein [Bacillus sp. MM2020_4]